MPARRGSAVPSKPPALRALAVAACFGLSFGQALPARATGFAIHARFCGDPAQLPSGGKRLPPSPDGPSACHAVCPRKQAAAIGEEEDPYTG